MDLKRFHRALVFIFFIAALSGAAAADSSNWNLDLLSEPYAHTDVSNNTWNVQLVNLTDSNNDPVDEAALGTDDAELSYVYNMTGGSKESMVHLKQGYYYANITVNGTKGDFFEAELKDDSSNGFEENRTRELNIGNLTVEVLTDDFYDQVDPAKDVDLKINVTDEWNNEFEGSSGVDVDFYITNGSWTSDVKDLNNVDSDDFWKNFGVSFNGLAYDSTYIAHANVTYSGASYENANGSQSILINTFPELRGEISRLDASEGCNNSSFFEECEAGATVNAGFNITSATANNVNMTVYLEEEDTGNWIKDYEEELSESDGLYSGEFDVPDFNTSNYSSKVVVEFNATNGGRTEVVTRNITYRSYTIQDKSSPNVYQGENHNVELLLGRYFTLKSLNSSHFENASIDITDPDGDQFDSFNLNEMDYSDTEGLFTKEVEIPGDATAGSYDLDVTAFNKYHEKKELNSGFNVQDIEATFNTSGDMDLGFNKTAVYTENFTVTNKLGEQRELEVELEGDIENFTKVNNGDNITLDADEKRDIESEFNISYVDDYSGDIVLTDTGNNYNTTINVEIDPADCDRRNGSLCLENTAKWENITSSERGYVSRVVSLVYLGENGTSTTVDSTVSGNVSTYLDLDPSSIDLNYVNDTESVLLNYSVQSPGSFFGKVEFSSSGDEVSINTWFESDVEATDTGIQVTDSINLGYLASGDAADSQVEIENTGDVEITGLEVSSSSYDASIESASITGGETITRDIEFNGVETESGTVTVTGETSEGDITDTISVSANPVPDYTQQTSSLETRIQDLTSRAESEQTRTRLQELETEISQIETLYQQENYQQAEESYQSVESELDSIENQISGGSPGSPGDQPGEDDGGMPLIPIVAGLVVVLLIGFVGYTSIIPEEGDPLYNLLGE